MIEKLDDEFFKSGESILSKVLLPLEIDRGNVKDIINILIQNSAYRIYVLDTENIEKFLNENPKYEGIVIPISGDPSSDSTYNKIMDFCEPIFPGMDIFERADIRDTINLLYNLHVAAKLGAEVFVNWHLRNFRYRMSLLPQTYERDQLLGLLNIYETEPNIPMLKSIDGLGLEKRLYNLLLRDEYYRLSKLNRELGTIGRFKNPLSQLKTLKIKMRLAASNIYNVNGNREIIDIIQTPVDIAFNASNNEVGSIEKILKVVKIIPTDYAPPIRIPDPYLIAAGFNGTLPMWPIGSVRSKFIKFP